MRPRGEHRHINDVAPPGSEVSGGLTALSKTSSLDAAIKGLMLVPIAVLAYFKDLPVWASTLYSAHLLGFLGAAIALFALGLWLKRGIVRAYLEMSRGSNALGIMFLAAAVVSYIYGSWYGYTSWFHYESLLLLALSYGSFRLDVRFMRLTAPLLATFAFVFPFPFFYALVAHPVLGLYVPLAFVGLFGLYVRAAPKAMVLPALLAAAGTAYWLYPAYWVVAFAPLLCLALLVPDRLRTFEQLPSWDSPPCALHGEPATLASGFCAMCGRKRTTANKGSLGLVGLGVVLVVLYALSSTQVPILSLQNGVPSSVIYSPQQVATAQLPPTPAGWLVNSSTLLNPPPAPGTPNQIPLRDIYAVKLVYVPSYHPETENYTLYYEVSTGAPIISNSWTAMPGWNYSSSVSEALPMQGHVSIYTSPRATLLVYGAAEQLYFFTGKDFQLLEVGVSVSRQFEGTNVSSATAVFSNDLPALFQSGLVSEGYYSAWNGYFVRVSQTASAVEGLLALVSSAGLVFWGAYRVELSDTNLDSFVTAASGVDEDVYSLLETQLGAARSSRTGNEIAAMTGVEAGNARMLGRVHDSLRNLERNGLMRTKLVERGSDLVLTWKVPV